MHNPFTETELVNTIDEPFVQWESLDAAWYENGLYLLRFKTDDKTYVFPLVDEDRQAIIDRLVRIKNEYSKFCVKSLFTDNPVVIGIILAAAGLVAGSIVIKKFKKKKEVN